MVGTEFTTQASENKCSICEQSQSVRKISLIKRVNEYDFSTSFSLCIYCRRKLWEVLGNSIKRD